MKKAILFLLAAVIIILPGCKPNGLSDAAYSLGIKSLEIIDAYLDFDITAADAMERLEGIDNSFDDLGDLETYDFILSNDVSNVYWDIRGLQFDISSYDDVLDGRNKLAESLNRSKR